MNRWAMTTPSRVGVDGKGGRAAALNGLFDEWTENNQERRACRKHRQIWGQSIGCSGNSKAS